MDDNKSQPTADEKQPASPAEQSQGGEPSPEELEFSKLSGSAQERFKAILRKNRELNETAQKAVEMAQELQRQRLAEQETPPAQEERPATTTEQELAIENLRKFGVWTKKDQEEQEARWKAEQEEKQRELQDSMLIETEYSRLENKHNGSDGLPRFDREIVEAHMQESGVYNPEKAYEDLYRDEMFDQWAKQQSGGSSQVYTEKPRTSVGTTTEPLSLDGLRERLRQSDGKEWWDKNRERLLPLLGELQK